MAYQTTSNVGETSTTSGTGPLSLSGAITGMIRFNAIPGVAVNDTVPYSVFSVDGSGNRTAEWEIGIGTYSAANTLTRTTVLGSSNAGAAVSFSGATLYVFLSPLGERLLQVLPDLSTVLKAVGASAITSADSDTIKLFTRKIAGRMVPKYITPTGVDEAFQDKISENGNVLYFPNNGTTVGLNLGIGWTTGGTVSHPTPSSTAPAVYSQQKRTRWANVVTTTNQILGLRTAAAEKRFWRGNAAGLGGFFFHARFAIGLWPAATVRLFVGLNDSTAGWVASDTLTGNGCGLWHDTTEAATVLNFVTRDGTTVTKSAITLAAPLAAGQCFDFWMWSAPNGSVIGYKLVELNTGTTLVDTTTSTTIPLSTAFMGQELAMSNGTANITVTTTAFELMAHSCQSDV